MPNAASATPLDMPTLRERHQRDKAALLQVLGRPRLSTRAVQRLLRRLSDQADALLTTLWQAADLPPDWTLCAVGGFGRQALFPYSDIDVLVLHPDAVALDTNATLRARAEAFIGSCWDVGLNIGSSVRSPQSCLTEAAKDVTVQTALLEARRITGDADLFAQYQHAFTQALDPNAFFVAKTLEMRQRHSKYDDTPYALEPNCKESPGGLRDLQVILWVARAAGLGHDWPSLARAGLATAFEVSQLERNEAVLSLIRARLHWLAKRREDRLIFDLQSAVAQCFGYRPPDAAKDPRAFVRPSEQLMRHYYWAAKAVTQLNQILLLNIEHRIAPNATGAAQALRPLDADFFENAGMIEVAHDALYEQNPQAILRTFLVYQRTPGMVGLSARTLRALYNARHRMDKAWRHDPVNRATFMQILQAPSGQTHAFRLMNQTSVLGRYLWAFRRIVGQMQHDLFHVYTVDQHTLMVLRNLRRFFMVEHAHEYPFCSELAAGWDKPWLLFVAALYHDIAKGRGGDHSELGAREARRFCVAHGVNAEDTALIEFVVRHHLSMSHVAQKSDLSDPDVIAQFARLVGNERYLTALYLFTVADVRGTSPKVWNAWKGRLLEDLYRATSRALGGHTPDVHALVQERQRDALVELALHAQPFASHKALWETLDVGYFMRHDAVEIAWHTRKLSRLVRSAEPVVRARTSPLGEGLQVLVYAPDQRDLFARICGYFDRSGLSIQDAHIHTSRIGYALDTFQIVSTQPSAQYREMINRVEVELAHVITAAGPLPEPSQGRVSRRVRSFPITPRVSLTPDEKGQRWLLTVSASDRVGLLYRIARVLSEHHIDLILAKVNTLGERVEDSFLIQGAALQNNRAQIDIETELLRVLA
ncbi:MAG: [protein-PII] uridylyltransferase [Rhodoferax sp.]